MAIRVQRGVVVGLTIQYEAIIAGATYPIPRRDSAHGAPHPDALNGEGLVIEKRRMSGKPDAEIFEPLIEIKSHWPANRQACERRRRCAQTPSPSPRRLRPSRPARSARRRSSVVRFDDAQPQ